MLLLFTNYDCHKMKNSIANDIESFCLQITFTNFVTAKIMDSY